MTAPTRRAATNRAAATRHSSQNRSTSNGRSASRHARSQGRPTTRPIPSELDRLLDEALARPLPTPTNFAELGVNKALVTALSRRNVTTPFAIQACALPDALAGRDVLGRAQTGSGKTLAFGLPMMGRLAGHRSRPAHPRGLVLVPTRELAMQVADELRPLADAVGLRLVSVFGGVPYGRQLAALERGIDIVVATPGRLIDLIDRGACRLGDISVTVLDEADHMADLGFLPAVVRLLNDIPAGGQRLLFSATLDRGVDRLVRDYLVNPAVHAVAPAASPVDTMDHQVFLLDPTDKLAVMAEMASRPARTLVFVRTKHGADRLAKQLSTLGSAAKAIHGNLSQNARQRALADFTVGHPRVLIATDVAARGIHVDDVDLVVHFDPPNDSKDYLHRSGRTARAGASGTVVSLVIPAERRRVQRLHQDARVNPVASSVKPGHAAVQTIATSGIPVPAEDPRPRETLKADRGSRQRDGRPGRSRHQRRGASANSRMPSSNRTAARKPRTRSARAGDATT